ncbi:MAG TPA: Rpn family recombination-promoting nuclease/putative transposase, partial [Allocoleopsis sp.]
MKTDSIYYQLFLQYPSIFFELIKESPETANLYEFTSREIKDYSFRLDGLFLPKSEEAKNVFYVVEVQSQPDEDLYYRIFGEFFTFLRQYKPRAKGRIVVIYPSRSIEIDNLDQFDIIDPNKITRIYLEELEEQSSLGIGVIKLVVTSEKK